MKAFVLHHPKTIAEATHLLAQSPDTALPMAGGQDLLGMLKDYIVPPEIVVDLKRIPGLNQIEYDSTGGLKIGALATIAQIDENEDIRAHYPALAEAARSVGSLQIRNMGTLGGNLCQRPRCWYFRSERFHCLKKGGSECFASADTAENKYNAIFGGGPSYIVHPSDLAPVLVALDATLTIAGPNHESRSVRAADFYILPADGPIRHETVLKAGEIVTQVLVPKTPLAGRSVYLKFREKDSMDWALASVAMAVEGAPHVVRASIVLGGVAPIPWRASAAESALKGRSLMSAAVVESAAAAAIEGAQPLSQNGVKIPITQALVRRAAAMLVAGARRAFTGAKEENGPWLA